MANITFSSPLLRKDLTVYATAGDNGTILKLAQQHKIPIPFDCQDGECASCLIEVRHLSGKPVMGAALTDKEKSALKAIGRITEAQIEDAVVRDIPPPYRLACQYIVRDEEILVRFTGEPGGA